MTIDQRTIENDFIVKIDLDLIAMQQQLDRLHDTPMHQSTAKQRAYYVREYLRDLKKDYVAYLMANGGKD